MSEEIGNIDISPLKEPKTLLERWLSDGLSASTHAFVEPSMYSNCHEWFLVAYDNEPFAFFSLTPVPNKQTVHLKSMHVVFKPLMDEELLDKDVQFEKVEESLYQIVNVLAYVFSYALNHAFTNSRDKCCKIYSEHENIKTIYFEFAKRIKSAYPDKYAVKFYGNWVEITEC